MIPNSEFSDLREYTLSIFDKWERQIQDIPWDKDAEYQEVRKRWPKNITFKKISLDSLKHVNLFYTYSNALIHECKSLTNYPEDPEEILDEPFYASVISLDDGRKHLEMIYPLDFFKSICNESLNKLEKYYIKQKINPHTCFNSGTYWVEELSSK